MRLIIWTIVLGIVSLRQATAQEDECEYDNTSAISAMQSSFTSSAASSTSTHIASLLWALGAATSTLTSGSSTASVLPAPGTSSAPTMTSIYSTLKSSLSSSNGASTASTPLTLSLSPIMSFSTRTIPSSSINPAGSTPATLFSSTVGSTPTSVASSPSSSTFATSTPLALTSSAAGSTTMNTASSISSTSATSSPSAAYTYYPLSNCPTGVGYDSTPGILPIVFPSHNQTVHFGSPFWITWATLPDVANVAIVLCHGPPENCVSTDCIIPYTADSGFFAWVPRPTLEAQQGYGYGMKIIVVGGARDGQFQFSNQFGISQ